MPNRLKEGIKKKVTQSISMEKELFGALQIVSGNIELKDKNGKYFLGDKKRFSSVSREIRWMAIDKVKKAIKEGKYMPSTGLIEILGQTPKKRRDYAE